MKIIRIFIACSLFISIVSSCKQDKPLPILGNNHTISDFRLLNQDSVFIDNKSLKEYVYVADFFFTSCPSICPKVSQQMLRIQNAMSTESMVKLVSYTIDPEHDTPDKLKRYAKKLGANTNQWHFLTGDSDTIFELADNYWVAAFKDKDAPGGFDHSGKIILVDQNRHIRSFCDGTEPESVTRFIKDIKNLVSEVKGTKQ